MLGALAGLAFAAGAAQGFHRLANTLPRAEEIALNWRVAVYSLLRRWPPHWCAGCFPPCAARGAGWPARLRKQPNSGLHAQPVQWLLVGVQVTLAVTLLVGAGLLLRSFQELGRVSPGFDPAHVLTLQITGSWGETSDMKSVLRRIDRTLEGLRSMPGVADAATAAMLPGPARTKWIEYKIDGHDNPGHKILADTRWVSVWLLRHRCRSRCSKAMFAKGSTTPGCNRQP